MEVVLEAVELGTTDPFQNFDEMVVLLLFFAFFPTQSLVRSSDDHFLLAASVSDAGTDQYVCGSNFGTDRSFVLFLGITSSTRLPISRYQETPTLTTKTMSLIPTRYYRIQTHVCYSRSSMRTSLTRNRKLL